MATFSHISSPLQRVSWIEPQHASLTFPEPIEKNESEIVGQSLAMKRLHLQIRRIGPHFRTVLINGERGAGKEMVARALHRASTGSDGPFVVVTPGNRIDCLTKIARCSTLFFKGIDEMPLETQEELLEVLRNHEWAQDGLAASQKLSTRIIASANRDLKGLVASGRFRQELFQRITMVQIRVPPLRERAEDIPALAARFLERFANGLHKKTIAKNAMELLTSHSWPGNARELESMLKSAVSKCDSGIIQVSQIDLPSAVPATIKGEHPEERSTESTRLQEVVDRHVLRVLKDCAGNKLRAAELLGISRSTLYRMLDACAADAALDIRLTCPQ